MKILLKLSLVLLLVVGITSLSHAESNVMPGNKPSDEPVMTKTKTNSTEKGRSSLMVGPNEKMFRGVKNLLFGWTEIPKSIVSTTKESNPIVGLTLGTLKGVRRAFPKTVSGIADVVTFPVGGYKEPLINPSPLNGEGSTAK